VVLTLARYKLAVILVSSGSAAKAAVYRIDATRSDRLSRRVVVTCGEAQTAPPRLRKIGPGAARKA